MQVIQSQAWIHDRQFRTDKMEALFVEGAVSLRKPLSFLL
jgi:hypothetical protein